ncbi:MAG: transcription termination factor NusA [Opitutales bacterium]|nr:transcription termination factor NusA [Opitutales bacterium]
MNKEILDLFKMMEDTKKVKREELIPAICDAILEASKKGVNAGQDVTVSISPVTGDISMKALKTVVEAVSDPLREIDLRHARLHVDDPKLGDCVPVSIDPETLGRISSQTVRQRLKEFLGKIETRRLVETYSEQVGQLISGIVIGDDRGTITVDIGNNTEAKLPRKERVKGETLIKGSRHMFLLKRVGSIDEKADDKNDTQRKYLILSRADEDFVLALVSREVTEMADGTISIVNVARKPGSRTKILVASEDPNLDPVGCCVGIRGSRVKALGMELGKEKVDFVKWTDDVEKLLCECFKVNVYNVQVDEAKRVVSFGVTKEDAARVIGQRGENLNLTQNLLGYHLKVNVFASSDQGVSEADKTNAAVAELVAAGIPEDLVIRLMSVGYTSLEGLREPGTDKNLASSCNERGEPLFTQEEIDGVIVVANR